jgi:RNA polymerase sigma factor (sigma-70 family)
VTTAVPTPKSSRPKRDISNEEFNRAKADPDNRGIMRAVAADYRPCLDPDELESACDIALWRALQYFDPSFGQKFTSSLHRVTGWECARAAQRKRRFERRSGLPLEFPNDLPAKTDNHAEAEDQVRVVTRYLDGPSLRLIRMVYIQGRSISEVAEAEGLSKDTVRERVFRALDRAKECSEALPEVADDCRPARRGPQPAYTRVFVDIPNAPTKADAEYALPLLPFELRTPVKLVVIEGVAPKEGAALLSWSCDLFNARLKKAYARVTELAAPLPV